MEADAENGVRGLGVSVAVGVDADDGDGVDESVVAVGLESSSPIVLWLRRLRYAGLCTCVWRCDCEGGRALTTMCECGCD